MSSATFHDPAVARLVERAYLAGGVDSHMPPIRLGQRLAVYVAAPLAQRSVAEHFAAALRNHGFAVVSRWHRSSDARDPSSDAERFRVLSGNIADLERCDAMLALCHAGTPRATFGEITWTLRQQKPVVWAHHADGSGRNIFDAHKLVRRVVFDGSNAVGRIIAELDALARERDAS